MDGPALRAATMWQVAFAMPTVHNLCMIAIVNTGDRICEMRFSVTHSLSGFKLAAVAVIATKRCLTFPVVNLVLISLRPYLALYFMTT